VDIDTVHAPKRGLRDVAQQRLTPFFVSGLKGFTECCQPDFVVFLFRYCAKHNQRNKCRAFFAAKKPQKTFTSAKLPRTLRNHRGQRSGIVAAIAASKSDSTVKIWAMT